MKVSVDTKAIAGLMSAIADAAESWTDEKRDRFSAEWTALTKGGCEWVEFDGLIASPSQDMIAHARAYGVPV